DPFDDATMPSTSLGGAAPAEVVVSVKGAPSEPKRLRVKPGVRVVGSGRNADLRILDPRVSRSHVELELGPAGVAVRDLGSRNGTFYLGQRVQAIVLTAGGRIRLGED